jgi:hypothetical protein
VQPLVLALIETAPVTIADAEGESDLSGDPTLTYVDLILRYIW